jgi:uridine kinase
LSINYEKFFDDIKKAKDEFDVVIVEGFLIYNDVELIKEFDKMYFIEIQKV